MIEQIIILSLITFAVWWVFQAGEIFGFVQTVFANWPAFIKNPLFDCAVCMHFWWGSASYWLIYGSPFHDWRQWLIVIIAGMGLNAILVKLWPCCNE